MVILDILRGGYIGRFRGLGLFGSFYRFRGIFGNFRGLGLFLVILKVLGVFWSFYSFKGISVIL